MIFETHAHYDDPRFDEDREELISSLPANGITEFVNICAEFKDIDPVLSIIDKYDFAYGTIGVHPSEVYDLTEEKINIMKKAILDNEKIVAVGEIGLDYHEEDPDKASQKKWFIRQLELAKECSKSVVIHSRDAAEDTRQILDDFCAEKLGGVIHCYSGSPELAQHYVSKGYFIGVGGVVTFKNGKKLKETVKSIPLENIVLETDCPYLAPMPHRGERNSSLYLPLIADEIASLKGITREEVERVTFENAERLYGLK